MLILDEATSALDTATEAEILKVLQKLEGTITIVMISHDQKSIAHVKNRIQLSE